MAEISTGASGLSPAKNAKGEECRVLEVDDIDELLTGIQAEPEYRLGALEPSTGDSFLCAFKVLTLIQLTTMRSLNNK
jgi:hypothetical protein